MEMTLIKCFKTFTRLLLIGCLVEVLLRGGQVTLITLRFLCGLELEKQPCWALISHSYSLTLCIYVFLSRVHLFL